ncbi:MAG TPA: glycosyltransferase family 4 protein [Rhodothermales bacterium]|nr:glycosyltransferase family 4 protein [Rhodothermales bacterium]
MRLALLTNGIFPCVIGGMQKHSFYLAKYMARQGVDVDVYYALHAEVDGHGWDTLFSDKERARLTGYRIERPRLPYFPSHYMLDSYRTSVALIDAMQAGPHVDFIYAQGFAGWKAVRLRRSGAALPPVGVNPHGLEMYQRPATVRSRLESYLFMPYVSSILRSADVALSLGGGLSRIMQQIGVPEQYILPSPNGVSEDWLVDKLPNPHSPRKFVFLGRYERRKGVEELHKVLPPLLGEFDMQFNFIGPIPEQLRISSPKVKYWGLVREEARIRNILRASDVLVCPSYSEGMPTVILEAMASGLAVIGTQVGAVDAMVSESNGWLIAPGSASALRASLQAALTVSEDVLQAKKQYSRRQVEEEFLWDVVAQKTIDGIESYLSVT